jgi:DNA-binding Lrp family transcriptional regulator
LNTKIGSENEVLNVLKEIDSVQEAFNLWGVYDIIAKIKVDTTEKLKEIVNTKLLNVLLHSKLTVITTDTINL